MYGLSFSAVLPMPLPPEVAKMLTAFPVQSAVVIGADPEGVAEVAHLGEREADRYEQSHSGVSPFLSALLTCQSDTQLR